MMTTPNVFLWAQALDNESADHCYQVDESGYATKHEHPEQVTAAIFKIVQNGKNDKDADQLHSIDVCSESDRNSVIMKFPVYNSTKQPIQDAAGRQAVITLVIQDIQNTGLSTPENLIRFYDDRIKDPVLRAVYPDASTQQASRDKIYALLKNNLVHSKALPNWSGHTKNLITIGAISLAIIIVWQLAK